MNQARGSGIVTDTAIRCRLLIIARHANALTVVSAHKTFAKTSRSGAHLGMSVTMVGYRMKLNFLLMPCPIGVKQYFRGV
jgi:hypothetical protein